MKATFIYAPVNVPVCVRAHTHTYTPTFSHGFGWLCDGNANAKSHLFVLMCVHLCSRIKM